jgi:uncharacterized protein (DUF433 family)
MLPFPPTQPVPLEQDRDGVFRVGGTRVTLEVIVAAFADGATAEEIAQDFPSVPLPDVYAVISYYLRHRDEIEAYLNQRKLACEATRAEIGSQLDPQGIRDRLLARRKGQD